MWVLVCQKNPGKLNVNVVYLKLKYFCFHVRIELANLTFKFNFHFQKVMHSVLANLTKLDASVLTSLLEMIRYTHHGLSSSWNQDHF